MTKPDASAYLEARLRARALLGDLSGEQGERIAKALQSYANGLGRALRSDLGGLSADGLSSQRALLRAKQINEEAARKLSQGLTKGTAEGRALSFERSLEVWAEAGRGAAETAGVDAATLARVRPPSVTVLGAYEAVGAAETWQTLLRSHVRNAAAEANAIVREALASGVGPDEVARRLRRYVVGSEGFADLFEEVPTKTGKVAKIDLRGLSASERDAARMMRHNARRIAFTEMGNARQEAEVQHSIRDPLVGAVRWLLSPDRGNTDVPDACDALAEADWYGLGAGVFPVDKVPGPPHPWDRCELETLTRDLSRLDQPKLSPDRRLSGDRVRIPRKGGRLTRAKERRVREQAERAVAFGETALAA